MRAATCTYTYRAMAGAASSFPAVVVLAVLGAAAAVLAGSASASWHPQVFVVGGEPRGWRKPTAPNEESYNHWAIRNRFHVGDFLHFKYEQNDSVLVVTRDAYQLCVVDKPTLRLEGGDTRLRLDHSGACYFISGAPGHCDAGQRMTLHVMVPQQQGDAAPGPAAAAPASAPAAMPPEDEGGTYYTPPPGARRSPPAGSGSGSLPRPPPQVAAPGAGGNKTAGDAGNSTPSLRGHRVLGVVAMMAALLLLLLPA